MAVAKAKLSVKKSSLFSSNPWKCHAFYVTVFWGWGIIDDLLSKVSARRQGRALKR